MEETLNFDFAFRVLLYGEKIYSLQSKTTFWEENDTVFVEDDKGCLSVLSKKDELFTFDEIMGRWLIK